MILVSVAVIGLLVYVAVAVTVLLIRTTRTTPPLVPAMPEPPAPVAVDVPLSLPLTDRGEEERKAMELRRRVGVGPERVVVRSGNPLDEDTAIPTHFRE